MPIGRPIPNARLYVVDEEGQPVPPGVSGELLIGGPGVARGYVRRPELTAERFRPDRFAEGLSDADALATAVVAAGSLETPAAGSPETPAAGNAEVAQARLYRTGDRVRYRRDGTVEFLGRVDEQVKLRGHRIELGEIEAVLRGHPSVREAAVVLHEERQGSGALVAYVAPMNGAIDVEALRVWAGRALPPIMVPALIQARDALPRTPNGKLDRRALVRSAPPVAVPSADSHAVEKTAAPRGDVEATIADVWREVLGVSAVDATASFFDLGGHSLLAAQVVYLLRARLGLEITITDLFRFPTVSALGRHLGEADRGGTVQAGRERAEARRDILARRRLARQPSGR